MFNLETAIGEWRQQMLAAGILAPVPLEELESHLREEINQQMKAGFDEQEAFELAEQQIGQPKILKSEFQKEPSRLWNWNHPLVWTAWGAFGLSFGLPACGNMWGWQCAGWAADAFFEPDFRHDWFSIHLLFITLANLFMLAAPILLARFATGSRARKWLRIASFASLLLVWSFLTRWFFSGENSTDMNLQAGSYLWALSFGLLVWATFPQRTMKGHYV